MPKPIRIATCQFPVEGDIAQNRDWALRQIAQAAEQGARIVHFSEAALSGYAGVDVPDFEGYDWPALREATRAVCRAAAEHRVWVLVGSAHPLTPPHKPHNCVYVISDEGEIADRYDKRFCTGVLEPVPELDLVHYTPGDHFTVFEVDGYPCSPLICYDYRFPELYRELKRRGVEIVFQSFHNARRDLETHETRNVWKDIVPATMMCHAATNHFWVSANNSTTQYSSWPSFFVRPDGIVTGRLELHEPGVLVSEVDPQAEYWDAPAPWRERAMSGVLYSGCVVEDPRSSDRTSL
ncbi:MAG: carbon-nitrogen hydrolase family protein [Planctomycetia bacterium]|nr:carbon-nitrogen hydrolase family protein [Planctomycetia bacterium]